MKTKQEIVQNWLPRYTGQTLHEFGQYILLTNFENYVKMFAELHNVPVNGLDRPMRSATAQGITIINFGMGSPNAATIMDCLSAIAPKAALFLGKCGGLKKKNNIGDLILPIAAIRDFGHDYWTGTVYTTNRRVWEWDEDFKAYLRKIRAQAIDMETATIFSTAFHNKIPTGALLLVSDSPMVPEGVKTEVSDMSVTKDFVEIHLRVGIESLKQLINNGITVKHLRY